MNRSLTHRTLVSRVAVALALLALMAAPAFAADDVIQRGADGWETVQSTYSSFTDDPIPAGFFCEGSEPFTGRIALRGVPFVRQPESAFDGVDTLVERLDDAVFDGDGVARTRIALVALNLASIEPVETSCGPYDVRVVLDKEQPHTEMTIRRTAVGGGTFESPLALNTRVIFTPVGGGDSVELFRSIELGSGSASVWSYNEAADDRRVRIDSDGDGVLDRELPAATNFRAGIAPAAQTSQQQAYCEDVSCHCARLSTDPWEPNWYCEHLHCTKVLIPCSQFPIPPERGPEFEPVPHEPTPQQFPN